MRPVNYPVRLKYIQKSLQTYYAVHPGKVSSDTFYVNLRVFHLVEKKEAVWLALACILTLLIISLVGSSLFFVTDQSPWTAWVWETSLFTSYFWISYMSHVWSLQKVGLSQPIHETFCKQFHYMGKLNWSSVLLTDKPVRMLSASWPLCTVHVTFFFLSLCNATHWVYSVKNNKLRRGIPMFMWPFLSSGVRLDPSHPSRLQQAGSSLLYRHTRTSSAVSQSQCLPPSCTFPSLWDVIIHEEKAMTLRQWLILRQITVTSA